MIPLDQFDDNDQEAYRVAIGRTYWNHKPGDVTAPTTQWKIVSRREVREMFLRFLHNTPELRDRPRDEQIRQFNLSRREAKQPKIEYDLLADVLV